jgi:hypothetical protein
MKDAPSVSKMESFPKLETSTTVAFPNSARNSYASTVDSYLLSARSSYISNSDTIPSSSRSSYSSIQSSFGRVSSFSRTSYKFSPRLHHKWVILCGASGTCLGRWKRNWLRSPYIFLPSFFFLLLLLYLLLFRCFLYDLYDSKLS